MNAPMAINILLTKEQMDEWEAGYREAVRLIDLGLTLAEIGCSADSVVWLDGWKTAWRDYRPSQQG